MRSQRIGRRFDPARLHQGFKAWPEEEFSGHFFMPNFLASRLQQCQSDQRTREERSVHSQKSISLPGSITE